MKFVCLITTAPDIASARKIAGKILSQKLAACIQLIPIESHYVWKGKVSRASEIQIVIKTRAALFSKIEKLLKTEHPYDIPELIELPISRGKKSYLDWISAATRS